MSIPAEGDFSPSRNGRVEPDRPVADRQGDTSPLPSNKYARRGNIAFIGGGAVLVIALSVLAGSAYFDASPNSPPKPVAGTLRSPPITGKRSSPAVAERPTVAAPLAAGGNSQTAAPVESPAVSPANPASPGALADNPPKRAEPMPSPQPQSPPTPPAVTPTLSSASPQATEPAHLTQSPPAVEDKEVVDPAARELILRGWAAYHRPYSPLSWQDARHDFEQALEIDARSNEARIGLASVLSTKLADGWSPVLQEDMPRAEHLLLAAADGGNSNRAAAHFTLGVLRQMQNRLSEARAEFETTISLDPRDDRAYLHLGETLLYLGQPEAGIPPLEEAIRLHADDPNTPITYWALGTCQLLSGQVDKAIDLLQAARAANPRLWVPYFYLAGAYGLQGNLQAARSALADSIRRKPAIKSLARMRAENAWLSNPQYWALQEKTLNVGLRRAGLPDQ
jgi:tetratricopeptide (TPR) repeat protein